MATYQIQKSVKDWSPQSFAIQAENEYVKMNKFLVERNRNQLQKLTTFSFMSVSFPHAGVEVPLKKNRAWLAMAVLGLSNTSEDS